MVKIDLYLLDKNKLNWTAVGINWKDDDDALCFPHGILECNKILPGNSIYGDCFSNYMRAGQKGILYQMRHICKIKVKPNTNFSSLPKTLRQPVHYHIVRFLWSSKKQLLPMKTVRERGCSQHFVLSP